MQNLKIKTASSEAIQLAMKQFNIAVQETSQSSAEAMRKATSPEEAYNIFIENIGEGMTKLFATALTGVVNLSLIHI